MAQNATERERRSSLSCRHCRFRTILHLMAAKIVVFIKLSKKVYFFRIDPQPYPTDVTYIVWPTLCQFCYRSKWCKSANERPIQVCSPCLIFSRVKRNVKLACVDTINDIREGWMQEPSLSEKNPISKHHNYRLLSLLGRLINGSCAELLLLL